MTSPAQSVQRDVETGGWAFVIPLLVIQAGRSILMIVTAPTRMLREHYTRLPCWILATAPLWIAGAISDATSRLLWWAGPQRST
jgi:low temperature requirement protein LtrA